MIFSTHDARFPEEGWKFRAMKPADIEPALEIIGLCDEDDQEWAEHTYHNRGLDGHFVVTHQKSIKGVTGYRGANGSVCSAWLSWTYLHPDSHGKGIGSAMLQCAFEKMEAKGYRKAFVSVSDYRDEDGSCPYEAARKMYQNAGFQIEVQHENYYAPGESQILLGAQLNPKKPITSASPTEAHTSDKIILTGIEPIDETEGSYFVSWDWAQEDEPFDGETVRSALAQWSATAGLRSMFISVPGDHAFLPRVLNDGGFKTVGTMKDYFQAGVHEVHLRYNV